MFKSALWRSEKNKVKVEFKLQFHAVKLPQVGDDALVISVVPADYGKPTVKSDKATVRDGSCIWENPVYETVKFNRDPKQGKIHERMYYFAVGTGSSKAGLVGEASIDFANYADLTKVLSVSLPLKNSKTEAVLHVTIQRMLESNDQRKVEKNVNAKPNYKEHSLRAHLGNNDIDEIIKSNSEDMSLKDVPQNAEMNGNSRVSSGSDITMSSSESSSEVEIPWQCPMENENVHREPDGQLLTLGKPEMLKSELETHVYDEEHRRLQWEWLGNSATDASTEDSSISPRQTLLRQHLDEASDIVIERLKSEMAALSRQAEMSEVELQTLRKQIVKECKRSQDLCRELICLKDERDALKGECERLGAFQKRMEDMKNRVDSKAIVEELRQELKHVKELNSDLQIQLQKTQESNSELILAVQDLDEMLEQKDKEILDLTEKLHEENSMYRPNDDEEQKVLEVLVKEHSDAKEVHLLERQIIDLKSELEIFRRDKDELDMQMEQLALDYEIMKQENHDIAYKLEQSQFQEQLKMQYECSASYAAVHELEIQMENLENELKKQSKESADAHVRISQLEAHVKYLEEELVKQSKGFEDDLEALMQSKVEQEKRAIIAEETLRSTRRNNAKTAERLQEEFGRLSEQMESTFAANEKVANNALAEAKELRVHKIHLEEMIKQASLEHESIKDNYEARLHEVANKVMSMTDQIERMQSDIEDKVVQLEHQKRNSEETQKLLSDEILKLKDDIETLMAKNEILSEEIKRKEASLHQLKQMGTSIKEMELLLEQRNDAKDELENRIALMKGESVELQKELHTMRGLLEEKEFTAENLKSELESLQSEFLELKHSIVEDHLEKEKLKKQVSLLESNLKKKEDALHSLHKKIKDSNGRGTTLDTDKPTSKISKPPPRILKEVASLKERIKLLEDQIKLKESALHTSNNEFLEKEKDLHNKIKELEGRLEVHNQTSSHCGNIAEKVSSFEEHQTRNLKDTEEISRDEDPSTIDELSNVTKSNDKNSTESIECIDGLKREMASLKEKNELVEAELKEMQERYSGISLKFAEVEGERQQLIMKLRNLKNARRDDNILST